MTKKYRSLEPVAYVNDGKVVSVNADREIDLSDEEAKALAGRIVLIEAQAPSMFPDGAPIIDPTIVRTVPATPVAGEPVAPPAPEKPVVNALEKPAK